MAGGGANLLTSRPGRMTSGCRRWASARRPSPQRQPSTALLALYGFEGGVFGGNKNGAGDFNVELLGIIALVYGDAYAASGVDVQQGVAYWHVHEGLTVQEGRGLFVDLDGDFVSNDVA